MKANDKRLYTVKALTIGYDKDVEIIGYLSYRNGEIPCVSDINDTSDNAQCWEVNTHSICRNTGEKCGDKYIYDGDLVMWKTAFDDGMGLVEYDDVKKRYRVRPNWNYSGGYTFDKITVIEILGNVYLFNESVDRFNNYSEKKKEKQDE